jgi:hypothetical protein
MAVSHKTEKHSQLYQWRPSNLIGVWHTMYNLQDTMEQWLSSIELECCVYKMMTRHS